MITAYPISYLITIIAFSSLGFAILANSRAVIELENGPALIDQEFTKSVRYAYKKSPKLTDEFRIGAVEPGVCWFARRCSENSMVRTSVFTMPGGRFDIETNIYRRPNSSVKYFNFEAVLETRKNITAKQANKYIDELYFENHFSRAVQKREIIRLINEPNKI